MNEPILKTQPNERRCAHMVETHILSLPRCCPVTTNPQQGSTVRITYRPERLLLEVQSLHDYIATFIGGRGDVRSMEGMIQQIAFDCSKALHGLRVAVIAELNIHPNQQMQLYCVQE